MFKYIVLFAWKLKIWHNSIKINLLKYFFKKKVQGRLWLIFVCCWCEQKIGMHIDVLLNDIEGKEADGHGQWKMQKWQTG